MLYTEEDEPLNIYTESREVFPILTGWEPPSEKALEWFQLSYTADCVGAYVLPASTVLDQSAIVEGVKLFPAILSHLQTLYPEVYSPDISLVWAPARREFLLVEDR